MSVCVEIVSEMIKQTEAKQSVDLNRLRKVVAQKHKCPGVPRLTDIIAAIPEKYK